DALEIMSAHTPEDFPPHWEPPPRFLKGERLSMVLVVWEHLLRMDSAGWVREAYREKLKHCVLNPRFVDLKKFGQILNEMPESEALALLESVDGNSQGDWLRTQLELRPELRKKVADK